MESDKSPDKSFEMPKTTPRKSSGQYLRLRAMAKHEVEQILIGNDVLKYALLNKFGINTDDPNAFIDHSERQNAFLYMHIIMLSELMYPQIHKS